jgi:hypothetical protein
MIITAAIDAIIYFIIDIIYYFIDISPLFIIIDYFAITFIDTPLIAIISLLLTLLRH